MNSSTPGPRPEYAYDKEFLRFVIGINTFTFACGAISGWWWLCVLAMLAVAVAFPVARKKKSDNARS